MISILCPANYATGGTELLHQLGYKANILGYEANIIYVNAKAGINPVCDRFQKYNVPIKRDVDDSEKELVIIPEIYIPMVKQLQNHKCAIWWLSVDNARLCEADFVYIKNEKSVLHFVQSQYALEFLIKVGIEEERIFYLSDYINSDFFVDSVDDESVRGNTVLFNPRKGMEATVKLISNADYRIHWRALTGLTPEGMREVMKRAKVYIDFGNHPGKDRIPREAAICGCCVVTNRSGAANNPIDINIPERYKFGADVQIADVLNVIYDLLERYQERKIDYAPYISKIEKEYIEFEKDIVRIFRDIFAQEEKVSFGANEYIDIILKQIGNEDYKRALHSLVEYRINEYPETIVIDVLETAIRMNIGELTEAEVSAKRGLKKEPDNYELMLYLAYISRLSNQNDKAKEYIERAINCSKGTEDEQLILERCAELE